MPVSAFAEGETADSGTIVLWDGLLSNIPSGWVLCDGMNGTPNLLDQFARSVPDSSTNPGGTGGTHSKTLSTSQVPSHSHGGSTGSNGAHSHSMSTVEHTYSDNEYPFSTPSDSNISDASTKSAGSHTHSASLNNTGSGNSIDNRPAFYELAYIMKT